METQFIVPKIPLKRNYYYCQDCIDCINCGATHHRICKTCAKSICCMCECYTNNMLGLNNNYAKILVPYFKTLTDAIVSNENFDTIEQLIIELQKIETTDKIKIKDVLKKYKLIKKYNFSSIIN